MFNFCIYENRIFDLIGNEILPDSDGVVSVFMNGKERRFIREKMIDWLKKSGYKRIFKKPKKLPKEKPIKILKIKEKLLPIKKIKVKILKPQKKLKIKKEPFVYQKKGYGRHGGSYGFTKRAIICGNGKKYDSAYQASKELLLNRASIFQVCNGKYKHTKGFTFKYLN